MRRLSVVALVLLSLIGAVSYLNRTNTSADRLASINGVTMGTSYHIKLVPTENWTIDLESLHEKVKLRLADIDNKMSTFKESSDVSRFNSDTGDNWVEVTAETMLVVGAAQSVSQLTSGSFDITIGELVNLWGFGPTINIATIPATNEIETLLTQSGYQKLQLQQNPPALRKSSKMLYIDLSAIAKGYAVDAIAKMLLDYRIENYLIEIGGEIVTRGYKTEQKPWVIGIEAPTTGQRTIRKRLHLQDVAMATSGDYRNYFEHQGVRYSHTIDPATGYPISHRLASVTVIDGSCMRADALATAIMVMGEDLGMAFAEAQQLAIMMLVKDGDSFIEKQSLAFKAYL